MNEEDQRRTAFVEFELAAVWQGHERGVVTSHEVHRRLEELEGLLWRRVLGRSDDLVISGGVNVHPDEVEAVLAAHPAVAEAAVHGRADPEWGEAVVATVVLRPGAQTTAEALRRHCAARLAAFKVPKAVAFAPALPRTASGKVARAALR